jgi:hypothetical protein
MKEDISDILARWAFQPGQPNVRCVVGADDEPRIQIRLDLGILQMFADGRPDGEHPHGHESLLEYFESRIEDSSDQPEDERFKLSSDDCQSLRDESVQYYHRYMAMLVLEDFDGVVRDTTRNLRVLDLCANHAAEENDQASLEQYRPYIVMVRTRALASQSVKDNEPRAAVLVLETGIDQIKQCYAEQGQEPTQAEQSQEVQMLREMREALAPKLPVSQHAELKQRLEQAIAEENYELAAILRDELKHMKE